VPLIVTWLPSLTDFGLAAIVSAGDGDGQGVVAQHVVVWAQHPALVGTGQHGTTAGRIAAIRVAVGSGQHIEVPAAPGQSIEGRLCDVLAAAALGESAASSATPSMSTLDAIITLKHFDTTLTHLIYPN
jgi:hypothetical protein